MIKSVWTVRLSQILDEKSPSPTSRKNHNSDNYQGKDLRFALKIHTTSP